MRRRVVILGGGITGLTAAYRLRKGIPSEDLAITVVEERRTLGGSIGSDVVDGFLIERGADSFLTTKAAGIALARELRLGSSLQGIAQGRVHVLRGGELCPLPEGFLVMASPHVLPLLRTPLFTVRGKVRLVLDLAVPRRGEQGDESIASFVQRRLGREVYDRAVEPLLTGIYAGDPERLSMGSLLPQFLAWERVYGGVLRGLRAAGRSLEAPRGSDPRPFASFRKGMGELVDRLAASTPRVTWRMGVRAGSLIRRREGGFQVSLREGTDLPADAVLVTTPAHSAGDLVNGIDSGLAHALRAIPYTSSAVVILGFDAEHVRLPEGSGFVVSRSEGLWLRACTFASQKFEGRAPPGRVLLRAFFGGDGGEVLRRSDGDLTELALEELRGPLRIRGPPVLRRVYRWPLAHPQYEVGHSERVAAISARCRDLPGLFFAGSAYRGIGLADCIEDARRAAEGVLAILRPGKAEPAEALP